MNREQRLAELNRRREQSLAGGGPERVAKIHAKGCLTARERLELLLDPGSFVEIGAFVTHRSARLRHGPHGASSATAWWPAGARWTAA